MAEFSKLVITNKGQALIAKMIAGEGNIDFTKISTSSTQYQLSQLEALTALTGVKQTSLISKVTRTNDVAIKVEAAFTNTDLTAGYYMRTLGLYAVDPDEGEILYAVTIETSGNCYMPPYNGVTVSGAYVQLVTTVGNADSVSLEVDQAAVATIGDIQELQKQISDLQAFVGYTDDDIFGVEVDFVNKKFTRLAAAVNRTPGEGFDDIPCFGGRKRCNVTDDGRVAAYYGEAGFSTTGKLTQAIDRNPEDVEEPDTSLQFASGTIVQTMVEQPKFYYKVVPLLVENTAKGQITRKVRYYVSPVAKAGFKLHPAFISNGRQLEKIYLAAFEGCLWDASAGTGGAYILDDAQVASFTSAVGTGDKLSSIANAKPMSGKTQNLTRGNARIIARNRGTGWEQSYAATVGATQILMLIEYASFDMQSKIGSGVSGKRDDTTNNMAENTGATVSLGNASGSVTNDGGFNIVSYRGEENLWGNVWTWVDGMNEQNPSDWTNTEDFSGEYGDLFVSDHGFVDDSGASPYENTNLHPCYGEGYISAFCYSEEFDWMFITGEVSGNSSLPVGDYFWNRYSGWRVAILGGQWNDGSRCGGFCWHLHNASSYRGRSIGGRLVYVPQAA